MHIKRVTRLQLRPSENEKSFFFWASFTYESIPETLHLSIPSAGPREWYFSYELSFLAHISNV